MIYFLYGDTTPLQIKYEEILIKIKNNFPNIPEKIFDASLDEVTLFFDNVSSNSIFSPHELIILKRAESLKNLENVAKSLKLYNLSQKEIIIIYEEFLSDYGKAKNPVSKKILDSFADIAEIICYRKENEKKAIIFMLQDQLNISEYEAEKLSESIGDDFFKVKNEVEKIKNFLDGETFSLEKVKPILSVSKEFNLKNLIEQFLYSKEVFPLLEFLQKEKNYNSFIYSLSDELITLLKLTLLCEENIFSKEISYKKFNDSIFNSIKDYFLNERGYPHPYNIFVKIKNVGLFNSSFISDKLNALLELEYLYKSGNSEIEILVDLFIVSFFKKV